MTLHHKQYVLKHICDIPTTYAEEYSMYGNSCKVRQFRTCLGDANATTEGLTSNGAVLCDNDMVQRPNIETESIDSRLSTCAYTAELFLPSEILFLVIGCRQHSRPLNEPGVFSYSLILPPVQSRSDKRYDRNWFPQNRPLLTCPST